MIFNIIFIIFIIYIYIYITLSLNNDNEIKYIYMKIENEMLFTPIIVETYIHDEYIDTKKLVSKSYIEPNNENFCLHQKLCKFKKNGSIMTKHVFEHDKYIPLLEYSEIPIIKTNIIEYIWLSFKRKDNDLFFGNQKIVLLDNYCDFKGFYDTIYHKTHVFDKIFYIYNNNTDINNLITFDSFKYLEQDKNTCIHTLNVNLTKFNTKINSIDIRLKYA
jgi:hypothetical protein